MYLFNRRNEQKWYLVACQTMYCLKFLSYLQMYTCNYVELVLFNHTPTSLVYITIYIAASVVYLRLFESNNFETWP